MMTVKRPVQQLNRLVRPRQTRPDIKAKIAMRKLNAAKAELRGNSKFIVPLLGISLCLFSLALYDCVSDKLKAYAFLIVGIFILSIKPYDYARYYYYSQKYNKCLDDIDKNGYPATLFPTNRKKVKK